MSCAMEICNSIYLANSVYRFFLHQLRCYKGSVGFGEGMKVKCGGLKGAL